MSGVKRRPKMTLAMLKGKPSTLSVPSIRFSSGDEDVEMEDSERWHDEKRKNGDSDSDDAGKESVSLFRELKGKIARTVEETLGIDVSESPALALALAPAPAPASAPAPSSSPSPDVAEEATELLDGESPESRVPSAKRSKQSSISTGFRNRRARLLNRGDSAPSQQSWSMSQLADCNQDDDALEDRLNSEYRQQDAADESPARDHNSAPASSSATPPPPTPPSERESGGTEGAPSPRPSPSRRPTGSASFRKLKWAGYLAFVVAVLCCVPLPPFITGLVTGACLVAFLQAVHAKYIAPRPKLRTPCVDGRNCEPASISTSPSPSPSTSTSTSTSTSVAHETHKGWMNELRRPYDSSDYHVGQTCPVLVRLEGPLLRISRPKTKIPHHAAWNETGHDVTFSDQRHYNLVGSRVQLLPVGLTRKRLWSRKYPLCVQLAGSLDQVEEQEEEDEKEKEKEKEVTAATTCIYLFARTCRDKEEWYWVLRRAVAVASLDAPSSQPSLQLELDGHMARWLSDASGGTERDHLTWANALLSRVFWDFLREPAWADLLVARIQRKLSKIKLPYFMEELTVTSLELGSQLPSLERVAGPSADERGLWVDLELDFDGAREGGSSYTMTLETKLNLMKLKKESEERPPPSPVAGAPKAAAAFDSAEEDSAESSTDDEAAVAADDAAASSAVDESDVKLSRLATSQGGGATSKKILRFVDKVSQSRYFQHATEFKYVRKAMEGVSNTRLILTVELQAVSGTLALNIPPPPTDRLWYGFRTNPKITLAARPRLGEREVTVGSVTEWIERKLIQEFQKVLVMPNMDDLVIPIMSSGIPTCAPHCHSEGGAI